MILQLVSQQENRHKNYPAGSKQQESFHVESLVLPGLEALVCEEHRAATLYEDEQKRLAIERSLSAKQDISAVAGYLERSSDLFCGSIAPTLFDQPAALRAKKSSALMSKRFLANAPKRELTKLRTQLATAEQDLEEAEINLHVVMEHQRASDEGRIDANWWDAAMRYGVWHHEEACTYQMGSYPNPVKAWLRHLRFDLHYQMFHTRAAIALLTPQVAELAAVVEAPPVSLFA